jgi:hypothetical protein
MVCKVSATWPVQTPPPALAGLQGKISPIPVDFLECMPHCDDGHLIETLTLGQPASCSSHSCTVSFSMLAMHEIGSSSLLGPRCRASIVQICLAVTLCICQFWPWRLHRPTLLLQRLCKLCSGVLVRPCMGNGCIVTRFALPSGACSPCASPGCLKNCTSNCERMWCRSTLSRWLVLSGALARVGSDSASAAHGI